MGVMDCDFHPDLLGSAKNNERTASKLEFKNLLAKNKTKELVTRLKEIYFVFLVCLDRNWNFD